ncbi:MULTISPECIES: sigma-E processing peptidase SpoIIGA [Bacillus]|uniref:sigma-E processing peptidase SpoIIGA n=1 Tax=Bacillus TaxID=1386 RepID=UPI000BB9006D|nr:MULTISPECIES: sigma-E processing peptidase SpoIIGA [Bacillus]
MTLYLDVIWILNLVFDFLLLTITGLVLKRKSATWRRWTGAFIGSLIVVLMFTPLEKFVTHTIVKLLFSVAMVYVSFGFFRLRTFIENILVFYMITFGVGGGIIAMHFFLQVDNSFIRESLFQATSGFGDPISWIFVIIGFPCILYLSKKQFASLQDRKFKYEQLADITIHIGDVEITTRGLIDSGNQLQDPITKTPVMILQTSAFVQKIPEEVLLAQKQIQSTQGWPTFSDENTWAQRIRIVPYRAVGKETTLMLAIKADKAIIVHGNDHFECNKFLIGLTDTELSSEGEYYSIIHPKMITDGQVKSAS